MNRAVMIYLCVAGIAGCASAENDWSRAERRDNAGDYRRIINKYPQSEYAVRAKQRLAEIDEEEKKQRQVLEIRASRLADLAKQRIASGETPPPRFSEPGTVQERALAHCSPENIGLTAITPPFKGMSTPVLCENSDLGAKVVAWRRWYCLGESRICVIGSWRNNAPTFSGALTIGLTIKEKGGAVRSSESRISWQ